LPGSGGVTIGLTAGASTPNNIIGEVVARLDQLANSGTGH
jgi:4-hydroxy-3-methylbut-2-enyl diphosphate reductase IspH